MTSEQVRLQITADGSGVLPEVAKVRRGLDSLDSATTSLGANFAKLGGMLAGALSAGAIVSKVTEAAKAAIEFGDEMQKAAARTGLAAGQFALLADAAKMSDIGVDTLSRSLGKMQLAISEAGSGVTAQVQALNALGLSFEGLRQQATDVQFLQIADQISKLEAPADRTRAAVELFGKSGADLLPFFEQGAKGIRQATDEITRMGGAMSDEQIKKLADADDAVKRLSQSWQIFARALTSEVAPALTAVLNHLSNADTSKVDAARASQIRALLESRGPTVDFYNDTKALRVELEQIEERLAGVARQRQLLALSRGHVSDVLANPPPGFGPPATNTPPAKDPKKQTLPFGEMTPGVFASADTLGIGAQMDPTQDPEFLYQQQLQLAKLDLLEGYNTQALGLAWAMEDSKLGMILDSGQMQLAAEEAKNATLGASMGNLANLAAQQGGAIGKVGKAFAIAQTIWSTGTAVMNAMAQVPFPANIAAAASVAAMGVAQLANIKKTNIGSGGSVVGAKGGSVTGTSPSLSDTSIPANRDQALTQQSAVQIIVQGDLFNTGEATAQRLAEIFGDLINNRDMVFINGNSRQAAELRA